MQKDKSCDPATTEKALSPFKEPRQNGYQRETHYIQGNPEGHKWTDIRKQSPRHIPYIATIHTIYTLYTCSFLASKMTRTQSDCKTADQHYVLIRVLESSTYTLTPDPRDTPPSIELTKADPRGQRMQAVNISTSP